MDYEWIKRSFENGEPINQNNSTLCYMIPTIVNSFGVWEEVREHENAKPFYVYPLPALLMISLLVFMTWQLVHFFFRRIGALRLTSQIIAGILLSRTFWGDPNPLDDTLFAVTLSNPIVDTLGSFGYTMFMFLIGVKMDTRIIRTTGKKALVIGCGVVLVPTTFICFYFMHKLSGQKSISEAQVEYVVVLAISCLTAFPVVSTLMSELKMQNSSLGRLALSSGMIADLLSATLAVIGGCVQKLATSRKVGVANFLQIGFFVLLAIYVFRPAVVWVVKITPEGRLVEKKYISAIMVVMFGSAIYAEKLDMLLPMGPFILGLLIPSGAPLGSTLVKKYEPIVLGNLLPFLIVVCTMKHNNGALQGMRMEGSDITVMMILATLLKLSFTFFFALLWKMPFRDSLALAFVMTKKGVAELANASFALAHRHITVGAYTATITYTLMNSYIVPIVVKRLYDPSKKFVSYTKQNLESNQELRVVLCIHKPDNINPMINLLEASSGNNPTISYVLNLVELVGQSQPLFISHQAQLHKRGTISCSQNVIISFDQCQRQSWGRLSVKTFTSVSTPKFMHEDICTLALDNLATFIVLPFHRTWSVDGSTIVSDSKKIRTVTRRVLELAPCSVGILVDRSRLGGKTMTNLKRGETLKVCLIYIGGEDDREALALAKRMVKDTRIDLTVVRFMVKNSQPDPYDWEAIVESTQLKDVMANNVGGQYVGYIEELVLEGTETAFLLRSMVDDYDLFLVGRRGGMGTDIVSGLEEWSEFAELGTIGDYLASTDIDSNASVLVVQQQHAT